MELPKFEATLAAAFATPVKLLPTLVIVEFAALPIDVNVEFAAFPIEFTIPILGDFGAVFMTSN